MSTRNILLLINSVNMKIFAFSWYKELVRFKSKTRNVSSPVVYQSILIPRPKSAARTEASGIKFCKFLFIIAWGITAQWRCIQLLDFNANLSDWWIFTSVGIESMRIHFKLPEPIISNNTIKHNIKYAVWPVRWSLLSNTNSGQWDRLRQAGHVAWIIDTTARGATVHLQMRLTESDPKPPFNPHRVRSLTE